jgi:hypothetical protein
MGGRYNKKEFRGGLDESNAFDCIQIGEEVRELWSNNHGRVVVCIRYQPEAFG